MTWETFATAALQGVVLIGIGVAQVLLDRRRKARQSSGAPALVAGDEPEGLAGAYEQALRAAHAHIADLQAQRETERQAHAAEIAALERQHAEEIARLAAARSRRRRSPPPQGENDHAQPD